MYERIREMITLYQKYRVTDKEDYKEEADSLLDEIMESCNTPLSLSYKEGLCGIGAAIEYLIRNDFVDGDADDILEVIDKAVVSAIHWRPRIGADLANGMLGLACYLYHRLYYRIQSESPLVLDLKEQVIYLIDWMEESLRDEAVEKNYYEFYFVLIRLHQLDIFNAKVEKMLMWCNKELEKKHSNNR